MVFTIPFFPYSVSKNVSAKFLDIGEEQRPTLVFFGFSQCTDICPVALITFKELLNSYDDSKSTPRVIYVDIGAQSNSQLAQEYASNFHQSIVGYHASEKELPILSNYFGLNIKKYQDDIKHQGRTYLLHKEAKHWRIVKSFSPASLSLDSLREEI